MSQIAVVTAKLVTDAPRPGQGEMEANPMPDPNAMRRPVLAAATKAPAIMDGQDAADFAAGAAASFATALPAITVSAIFGSAMRTHRQQQNDRQRNAQHPKQYSATHAKPLSVMK